MVRARGRAEKGEAFWLAVLRENPRGAKPKRAKRFLFEVNNLGEGDRLHVGRKSLERRVRVEAS